MFQCESHPEKYTQMLHVWNITYIYPNNDPVMQVNIPAPWFASGILNQEAFAPRIHRWSSHPHGLQWASATWDMVTARRALRCGIHPGLERMKLKGNESIGHMLHVWNIYGIIMYLHDWLILWRGQYWDSHSCTIFFAQGQGICCIFGGGFLKKSQSILCIRMSTPIAATAKSMEHVGKLQPNEVISINFAYIILYHVHRV